MFVKIRLKYWKREQASVNGFAMERVEEECDAWADASDLVYMRTPPAMGSIENFKFMLPVCLAPEPMAAWDVAMSAWVREPGVVVADRIEPATPALLNEVKEAQIVLNVNEAAALKKQIATMCAEVRNAQVHIGYALKPYGGF